ncbi:hypothetical protein K2X85_11935 [bacterium]|nr:hypothetical protein [bacterium]
MESERGRRGDEGSLLDLPNDPLRIAEVRSHRSLSSDRPRGVAGGAFSAGLWVRLLLMAGLLFAVVAGFDRVRDPRFWADIFPGLALDTTLPPGGAVVEVAQSSATSGEEREKEVRSETARASEVVFNPLGLVQTGECSEIDAETIRGVVQDKTGSRAEESLILQQLLCRAATMDPTELARQSRRDLLFSNLVHESDRYRGTPVHRRGVLRSLVLHETDPTTNPYGLLRYYQGWMFTDDQPTNPTVVVFARLPEGISPGEGLSQEISIDAFYFKLLAFRSKDGKTRFAPMLVGDMPTLREKSHVIGPSLAQALGTVAVVGLLMAAYLVWQRRQDRDFSNRIGQTLPRPSATNSLFEEP